MSRSRTLLKGSARIHVGRTVTFGGGNVWQTALEHSPAPNDQILNTTTPLINLHGEPQSTFTIAELCKLADGLSLQYLDLGVRARDRVVIYIDDSFEDQLHLAALTQIGAIPVLLNGKVEPEIAIKLMMRAGPVGLYTDKAHLSRLPADRDMPVALRWTRCATCLTTTDNNLPDNARYRHSEDDPVAICHTSGTTGLPKLVVWSHHQSVAGPRFRLRTQREREDSTLLSALPQSHSGAIGFTFYALLAGIPFVTLPGSSPAAITAAARNYHPTMVLAFNEAFSALATSKIDAAAFASVATWINIGDSAHQEHIKRLTALGHHLVRQRRVPGSVFGDGLGSSELGWAALHRVVINGMLPKAGYIGTPTDLAEVRVFREDGREADVNEVGMLGVRSSSVTPGYWDDSDRYYRSMMNGYWLSGDLVYRDPAGQFFHMDRVVDVIRTTEGVGYSLLMEEVLMANLPDVADCAVIAGRMEGTEIPVAVARRRPDTHTTARDLLNRANAALRAAGQPPLVLLDVLDAHEELPTGATGKTLKRRLRVQYSDLSNDLSTAESYERATAEELTRGA